MRKNRGLKEDFLYFILSIILVTISLYESQALMSERNGKYLHCSSSSDQRLLRANSLLSSVFWEFFHLVVTEHSPET